MPLQSFTFRDKDKRKQIITIVHEDDNLVAVNKPAGLPVIPDHWNPALPNMRDLLQQEYEKMLNSTEQAVWVVHRIDADTSGILLFARTTEMHRELNLLFQNNRIQKTYLAIVKGAPPEASGVIDLPLRRHPMQPQFIQVHKKGKSSLTAYKLIETFKYYSLLEVYPETGRTHQIRVHLSAINCPLAVDPVYGDSEALHLSQIKRNYIKKNEFAPDPALISRLTLHAFSIRFLESPEQREYHFEASPPKDFLAALKSLGKWNAE